MDQSGKDLQRNREDLSSVSQNSHLNKKPGVAVSAYKHHQGGRSQKDTQRWLVSQSSQVSELQGQWRLIKESIQHGCSLPHACGHTCVVDTCIATPVSSPLWPPSCYIFLLPEVTPMTPFTRRTVYLLTFYVCLPPPACGSLRTLLRPLLRTFSIWVVNG